MTDSILLLKFNVLYLNSLQVGIEFVIAKNIVPLFPSFPTETFVLCVCVFANLIMVPGVFDHQITLVH